MVSPAQEVTPIPVEQELKQSYLDYAMSVIVGRALPDVRDGLKPVHRRALYAMDQLNNDWNKAYKKSARIVGDVIGKYHPHGDTAVYDTIVRMAQPFSMRYLLVDGQGNFGSVDGDSAAAMRYTEIRLTRISHAMMADLEKDTVDFAPNYDGSEMAPVVLPTKVPTLLVNGSSGIAVGMATNIPPHNLNEVISATIAVIDNPDINIREIMNYIPGPDFPTAGIINGRSGIEQAYVTGRGKIYMRARTEIEYNEKNGKSTIIIHELPYQVNKARLLEKIGELLRDKKIEGISALRDESDRQGMRVVIEVRKNAQAEVLLNNLYNQTQMQTVFGINLLAIDKGKPKLFNIKQILEAFLQHRRDVVTRRSIFDLNKAKDRAHILEGLMIALANIDDVIALIKKAKTPQEAKQQLLQSVWQEADIKPLLEKAGSENTKPDSLLPEFGLHTDGYHLSPEQVQAILDLRLHRLTGLEKTKIHDEYQSIIDLIIGLLEILSNPDKLHELIRTELTDINEKFGDSRRTEIQDVQDELTCEDLIPVEDLVVTLSSQGYVKSQTLDSYAAQHRGGRGKRATSVKQEDYVKNVLVANSHDTILCFSDFGKLYWLKSYQIPQAGRSARGRPIVNMLPLQENEEITTILPVKEYDDSHFVFMATASGKVKKCSLSQFSRPRSKGIIALDLAEDDKLIGAVLTTGSQDVMMVTSAGKAIRYTEDQVRPMGRTASGVRGIKLAVGQKVISLMVLRDNVTLMTATENGYGQRTRIDDYRQIGRGGQGVISIQVTERNGDVVAARLVSDEDEVLLITESGTMVRMSVGEISVIGRNTQGVRLIQLSDKDELVSMAVIRAKVTDSD